MNFYVGTSGWHYQDWRGRFYPEGLPVAKWLEFYARHFTTVELNNSFYRLPSEAAFANWDKVTPANFTFALKVSRYITHLKKLRDTQESVDKFVNRARLLGNKLGPLLYQLPPNMPRDDEVLKFFLATLPVGMMHVFEFRHQSWLDEGVFLILGKYNAGFCVFDMPDVRCPMVATADFAYVRFHGSASLYSSSYSDEELEAWSKRLASLARDLKALYVYFNNDVSAFAVENARTLISLLDDYR
ncbi:MAG: DUF72 domain-containing protein [Chloroflexi bacterium]|nr:DUF72 domain-containing protein [Chloroflexota bacterium]